PCRFDKVSGREEKPPTGLLLARGPFILKGYHQPLGDAAMKHAGLVLGIVFLSATLCHTASADDGGFVSVFNGKNLDGWKMQGKATWTVEDGDIVGKQIAGEKDDSWLLSEAEWSDFQLELEF